MRVDPRQCKETGSGRLALLILCLVTAAGLFTAIVMKLENREKSKPSSFPQDQGQRTALAISPDGGPAVVTKDSTDGFSIDALLAMLREGLKAGDSAMSDKALGRLKKRCREALPSVWRGLHEGEPLAAAEAPYLRVLFDLFNAAVASPDIPRLVKSIQDQELHPTLTGTSSASPRKKGEAEPYPYFLTRLYSVSLVRLATQGELETVLAALEELLRTLKHRAIRNIVIRAMAALPKGDPKVAEFLKRLLEGRLSEEEKAALALLLAKSSDDNLAAVLIPAEKCFRNLKSSELGAARKYLASLNRLLGTKDALWTVLEWAKDSENPNMTSVAADGFKSAFRNAKNSDFDVIHELLGLKSHPGEVAILLAIANQAPKEDGRALEQARLAHQLSSDPRVLQSVVEVYRDRADEAGFVNVVRQGVGSESMMLRETSLLALVRRAHEGASTSASLELVKRLASEGTPEVRLSLAKSMAAQDMIKGTTVFKEILETLPAIETEPAKAAPPK